MSARNHAPRIALVAGEVSGDWLGAGLMTALRRRYPEAVFIGVAGPEMRAAGCDAIADIDELSLFGVSEVVREIPRLLRLRRRLVDHFLAIRPDVVIGIDAPAFNTSLERQLRRAGLPTVHYVCPTVWAWRAGRIRAIREAADLVLAIFPFEPDYLRAQQVPVRYVGHRLADELPMQPDRAGARRALAIAGSDCWLGLLPGSRRAEVKVLGPAFIDTALWLQRRLPNLRLIAPMATPAVRAMFSAQLASRAPDLAIKLVDGRSREVMAASDALLIASGTATLEALLLKTPMVVAYAFAPLNALLARAFGLHKLAYFSMPNLLAGGALVPELRQSQVRAETLGPWVYRLLTAAHARSAQTASFLRIHEQLRCDADQTAAAAVGELLDARS